MSSTCFKRGHHGMCSPWNRKKGVIFLQQKSSFWLKQGVIFPPKSVKRGIFSVRGTSMVTIKQRESDARGDAPLWYISTNHAASDHTVQVTKVHLSYNIKKLFFSAFIYRTVSWRFLSSCQNKSIYSALRRALCHLPFQNIFHVKSSCICIPGSAFVYRTASHSQLISHSPECNLPFILRGKKLSIGSHSVDKWRESILERYYIISRGW